MSDSEPYNPLDKRNLGESVADALLRGDAVPLGEIETFSGAGIYAIYYSGAFDAYKPISDKNCDGKFTLPIYVGKAVPPGARRGNFGLGVDPGAALFSRIRQHASSVDQVENLDLSDFWCRFLVVDDIWIPLGENLLIAKYAPLWNRLVDGFGNHDPGSGRYDQQRSRWDVLHPGRSWAMRCRERPETKEQLIIEVSTYLRDIAA